MYIPDQTKQPTKVFNCELQLRKINVENELNQIKNVEISKNSKTENDQKRIVPKRRTQLVCRTQSIKRKSESSQNKEPKKRKLIKKNLNKKEFSPAPILDQPVQYHSRY